ncbi:unannotated protein [freshwater metagenome]|uniref:Unannotated protein n=1 Tax=freshwater metagenome TaxID=449393 RepID=A0A6J6BRA9_9ZZZZ
MGAGMRVDAVVLFADEAADTERAEHVCRSEPDGAATDDQHGDVEVGHP